MTFTSNATLAQRMAVRTACAKTPNVSPQPLPSNLKSAYELPQVTYQINKASNAEVAMLETCLDKYPSHRQASPCQDSSDEGN